MLVGAGDIETGLRAKRIWKGRIGMSPASVARVSAVALAVLFCHLGCGAEAEEGWEELSLRLEDSVWASSELEEVAGGRTVLYAASNVFDGSRDTCWVEGAPGDGIGESLTFVAGRAVSEIGVVNGFAKSRDLFRWNNRVKRAELSMVAAFTAPGLVTERDYTLYLGRVRTAAKPVALRDTDRMQRFDFPWTREEQETFLAESLERFLDDHPDFARAIAGDLGYEVAPEESYDSAVRRSDGGREEFLTYAKEAYSLFCVRLEIEEVYEGTRFDDTCIAELRVVFE